MINYLSILIFLITFLYNVNYILLILYILFVLKSKKVIKRNEKGSDVDYLTRYYIIPNNKHFNVFLHKFNSSDLDIALHNHPWYSLSVILYGSYNEVVPLNFKDFINNKSRATKSILRKTFEFIYREPETIHKIQLINENGTEQPVWTLFITGPTIQSWGFWCPKGLVDNKDFLTPDGLSVGKGCD